MLADLVHDCKVALAFLTRLPVVPEPAVHGTSLAASVVMFPVVGALIGLLGGVAYALASLGLPPLPAATVALATTIWLTGALHEDGLADVADGFGGGRTRAEKLSLMRDPRLGTFGALALVLTLLARIAALAALGEPWLVASALIAAGAASRAGLPALMASLAPARHNGLAAGAGRPHPLRAVASIAIAALLACALQAPAMALGGLIGAACAHLWVAVLSRRQIGGSTGDVLGAAQQLAEVGFLLGALALQPPP